MKIKRKDFKMYGMIVLASVLSLIIYIEYYKIDRSVYIVSFLSVLVRSFVLAFVLLTIENTCKNDYYSGGSFLLYSTALYNQVSIIKYTVPYLYAGSINNVYIRALGSLYIDIIIVVSSILFKKIHSIFNKHYRTDFFKIEEQRLFKVPSIIVYLFVIIFVVMQLSSVLSTGTSITSSVSRTMLTAINALIYITYALATIHVKRKNNRIIYRSCIPIVIVLVANTAISLITGKKNFIVLFCVTVLLGLLLQKKISFRIANFAAAFSPLAMHLLTIVSEALSKREGFYTQLFRLQYHAFRFDLSDLAVTISSGFSKILHPLRIIGEAINYALPSFINANKINFLSEYKESLYNVGLNGDFDFNDTFFSMGAQVAGFLGVALVFIIILFFYEWISSRIIRIRYIGGGILLVLVTYFSSCEADWSMFIYTTRDTLVYLLIAYIIFYLIKKIRLKVKT